MSALLGYVYALISSIFFGLYVVPRKVTKHNPIYFSLLMGFGFFISASFLYVIEFLLFNNFQTFFNPALRWSVLAGAIWAVSFISFVKSIDYIGLAKSNQWKNIQGPIGVFLSLLILSEFVSVNPLFAGLAAICIFISAVLFSISKSTAYVHSLKGIIFALFSAIGFGMVTVINKYVTINSGVYAQQVVWSFFIFFSILVYVLLKEELRSGILKITKKEAILSLIAGFLYLGASFAMLQSYKYIPASIGFTIIQLNALWAISIGILIFKEISLRKNLLRISSGFIFIILGVLFLALA